MTAAEACAVLATIPAGDPAKPRARAIALALDALRAAPVTAPAKPKARKPGAASPAQSRHVAAFLRERFPEGTSLPGVYSRYGYNVDVGRRSAYRDLMGRDVPDLAGPAAAQFAYGMRGGEHKSSKAREAALLMAARAS